MSDSKQKPWYYQPPHRERLYRPARAVRNVALGGGFSTGVLWLIGAAPAALILLLVAPETANQIFSRYWAAPAGAAAGLGVGLLAAGAYRRRFPENTKGPIVLLPLIVGLSGFVGLGYAIFGAIGGSITFLLCALGVLAFFYVEGARE